MPINYDAIQKAGGIGKGAPISVVTEERRSTRRRLDERESLKVKVRSGGRCEIKSPERCERKAAHVHHMISGIGRRARGISALAQHKQHACIQCHALITSKKLRRQGSETPRWTDKYERVA